MGQEKAIMAGAGIYFKLVVMKEWLRLYRKTPQWQDPQNM